MLAARGTTTAGLDFAILSAYFEVFVDGGLRERGWRDDKVSSERGAGSGYLFSVSEMGVCSASPAGEMESSCSAVIVGDVIAITICDGFSGALPSPFRQPDRQTTP